MSVILGLDPGSRLTGFGVVETVHGRPVCLACGQIRAGTDAIHQRLVRIHAGLTEIVDEFAPEVVAAERVFMHRNADAALKLGQARGAAVVAATARGAAFFEYAPNEVKHAVVGRGHAAKGQVQHMIQAILNLAELPPPDAADALAVAVCHAHTAHVKTMMGVRTRGPR